MGNTDYRENDPEVLAEGPKVLQMIDFALIRRIVLDEFLSQREVAKKLNKSRRSIQMALLKSEPATYTTKARKQRPRSTAVLPIVKAWLEKHCVSKNKR